MAIKVAVGVLDRFSITPDGWETWEAYRHHRRMCSMADQQDVLRRRFQSGEPMDDIYSGRRRSLRSTSSVAARKIKKSKRVKKKVVAPSEQVQKDRKRIRGLLNKQ